MPDQLHSKKTHLIRANPATTDRPQSTVHSLVMAEKTDGPPNDLPDLGDGKDVKSKDPGPSSSSLATEIAQQVLAALQKKPSSCKGESLSPLLSTPAGCDPSHGGA